MGEQLSTITKALAIVMSTIALSATAGPCSTTYNFVSKGEAAKVHTEIKQEMRGMEKELHSIEKRLAIIDSKQSEMHEDLKSILNYILRSKTNGD
tara:strand:+ start:3324 stop:3608 length:285 start_codon:yes stop_codon:yes gene_type:complete